MEVPVLRVETGSPSLYRLALGIWAAGWGVDITLLALSQEACLTLQVLCSVVSHPGPTFCVCPLSPSLPWASFHPQMWRVTSQAPLGGSYGPALSRPGGQEPPWSADAGWPAARLCSAAAVLEAHDGGLRGRLPRAPSGS